MQPEVARRLDRHCVKVLGQGDITISLKVTAHKFSDSAVSKITAAGGTATTL